MRQQNWHANCTLRFQAVTFPSIHGQRIGNRKSRFCFHMRRERNTPNASSGFKVLPFPTQWTKWESNIDCLFICRRKSNMPNAPWGFKVLPLLTQMEKGLGIRNRVSLSMRKEQITCQTHPAVPMCYVPFPCPNRNKLRFGNRFSLHLRKNK